MNLHVSFDDELLKKYTERNSSPLFRIYWTNAGTAYPEEQWQDFGSVVLSWWLVAAKSLLGGAAEADLFFMDGPFSLQARVLGNRLSITADDQSWRGSISTDVFIREILKAADKVQQKFSQLGIPDRDGLKVGVQQLKAAASQARTKAIQHRSSVVEQI